MSEGAWLVLVGTLVTALLSLIGVIWANRPKPEPLSTIVQELQDEMVRRDANHKAEMENLKSRVTELENQLRTVQAERLADAKTHEVELTRRDRRAFQLQQQIDDLSGYVRVLVQQLKEAGIKPKTGPLGNGGN